MSKLILYIFVIPFVIWALDSVNINVIFKLGKHTNYGGIRNENRYN